MAPLHHVSSWVPLQWPLVDAGFTQPYVFIYLIIYLFRLFRLLWFHCDITDVCEIRTVKIKKHTNKKNFIHTYFTKT